MTNHRSNGFVTLLGATALVLAVSAAARDNAPDFAAAGARSWERVKILADDNMEGRRAGTPGHRRAAEYVAEQFKQAGLEPGGVDGYFQPVNLQVRHFVEAGSSVELWTGPEMEPLKIGDDLILSLRGPITPEVEAPLVFAGYGLSLPQYGLDDLAGLDLKGKIVVTFSSAPKNVPSAAGAHFGSAGERWKVYRARGAVGMMLVSNPHAMDLPWERIALSRFDPAMALNGGNDEMYAGMKVAMSMNPARFEKLLEGVPHTAQELFDKLKNNEPLPKFDLNFRVKVRLQAKISDVVSENVIGVLPGSDPKLVAERVVLTAHLDHLGVGVASGDDKLFNGAMDNATGISALISVAQKLKASGKKPKRTVVFAAVTAEELGLLGSRAYVAWAQERKEKVVANLNSDMYMPLYPLEKLVVFGLDESELGADVRAVAKGLKVALQPDPQPQRNRFIRSDQYSFVRAGIPALALKVGFDEGSPQAAIEKAWFEKRYHAVADDTAQPVDLGAIGLYEELMAQLVQRVADRKAAPRWAKESVFGK
jgi:hypothetical protein